MYTLDIEGLKAFYQENKLARAFFDHYATRRRNLFATTVSRMLAVLKGDGVNVSRAEMITILQRMESLGCGQYVTGKGENDSRMVWRFGLLSISRAVTGEIAELTEVFADPNRTADAGAGEGEGDGAGEGAYGTLTHEFHLRHGLKVEIELPNDLTKQEAERLAMFVRSLPIDDEEE